MKSKLTYIAFIALIISTVACQNASQNPEKYQLGYEIAQNVTNFYINAQDNTNAQIAYQADYANILAGYSFASKFNKTSDFIEHYDIKLSFLAQYSDIMRMMQTNPQTEKDLSLKLYHLTQIVDSLSDTSLSSVNQQLRDFVNQSKFDANVALNAATEILYHIYNADMIAISSALEKSYSDFSKHLDYIPVDSFDIVKLTKLIPEPYQNKTTLVNIYKLNLRRDTYDKKSVFIKEMNELDKIISDYLTEFSSTNNSDMADVSDELQNYVKQIGL